MSIGESTTYWVACNSCDRDLDNEFDHEIDAKECLVDEGWKLLPDGTVKCDICLEDGE